MTIRPLFIVLSITLAGCVQTPPLTGSSEPGTAAAASARPTRTLAATVLQNTLQCGTDVQQPTVQWITDAQQLRQRYQQLAGQSPTKPTAPVIDFARESVLLIGMGQHPTGGYLLNYQQQPIRYDGEILAVEVSWQEPLPGYKQAQVLTSPCLLLRLPKVEVERVRVLDQEQQVRLDAAV